MKKTTFIVLVLTLLFGLFEISSATEIQVSDEATIHVNVSLIPEIKITVSNNQWDIGPIGLNQKRELKNIQVTVGNVNTKVDILATEPVSGWKLGDTPGQDQFAVQANTVNVKTQNSVLFDKIDFYQSKAVDLSYQSPTKDTKGAKVDQSFIISFKASLAN